MSEDDVFSVPTPFTDVAALAQGYLNRADGERLLLPLGAPCEEGQGVRFVVVLADGTPAFAGAGRAVQVSDQGETVPPEARYETLIDALQFDERSQPVYDYVVAVRNAAYGDGAEGEEAEAGEHAEVAEGEVAGADGYEEAAVGHAEASAHDGFDDEEPTEYVAMPDQAPAEEAVESSFDGEVDDSEAYAEPQAEYVAEPGEYAEPQAEYVAEPGEYAEPQAEYVAEPGEYAEPQAEFTEQPAYAAEGAAAFAEAPPAGVAPQSLAPEAIPTGILSRPALGVHWAPAPPHRPTPRPSSGLFQYNGSGLPVPARPPHPELDPAYLVAMAPHPKHQAAAAEAQAAEVPYAEPAAESYEEPGSEEVEPAYAQEALDEAGAEYAEDGAPAHVDVEGEPEAVAEAAGDSEEETYEFEDSGEADDAPAMDAEVDPGDAGQELAAAEDDGEEDEIEFSDDGEDESV